MARRRPESYEVAVRELEIEDVFVSFPQILSETLGFDFELSIIARQKSLPSGRLDLLVIGQRRLFLVELKIEPYRLEFLQQTLAYKSDLATLQNAGQLVAGQLEAILLVPSAPASGFAECAAQDVVLKVYLPSRVLEAFYAHMAAASFLSLRPVDLGVWNIHLINRVLYALPDHTTILALSSALGKSVDTVRHHLGFAEQLGLIKRLGKRYVLSDLGIEYVKARDPSLSEDSITQQQLNVLRNHIVSDPFASPIIFGIYSAVETVFILARNTYPVSLDDLITYYRETVGKKFEWSTPRSAFLGANAYANFAVELGLLAKVGRSLFLTPAGFRFVLMLQLHKGIKLVDALQPT